MLSAFGAEFVLTEGAKGMPGAIAPAQELPPDTPAPSCRTVQEPGQPGDPPPDHGRRGLEGHRRQDRHLARRRGHRRHDHRHGEILKQPKPAVEVFAAEPAASPVLPGSTARPAQDPGHRRRLRPQGARHDDLRRSHQGRQRRGHRDGAPPGSRRGHPRRHLGRSQRVGGLGSGPRGPRTRAS